MATFERYPQWLRGGIGLTDPQLPSVLEETVSPVIDIHQGGWGLNDGEFGWFGVRTSDEELIDNTTTIDSHRSSVGAICLVTAVFVSSPLGGSNYFRLVTPSGEEMQIIRPVVFGGGSAYPLDELGHAGTRKLPLIVPPMWRFMHADPAAVVTFQYLRAPAGSKVL